MSPRLQQETETIGERIRKQREKLGISVHDLAQDIQAPQKFVEAFEEDRYEIFSAKVYAFGFLKKLLKAVKFENQESLLQEFSNEWEVRMFRKKKELTPLPLNRGSEPLVTPARLGIGIGGVFLVILLLFLGVRLFRFVGTPSIAIEEPKNESEYAGPFVRVRGRTEKESSLTVNGRELKIDESGRFDEEIEFGAGGHTLEFLSVNRFGKESKEKRNIVIK